MKHEIIKTDNYLLVVGKDRKRGWFYCVRTKSFFHDEGEDVLCCNGDLAVDSHLPLNGADVIDDLPLLPPLEEDNVEKKAIECFKPELPNQKKELEWNGFIKGYNKAKEKYNLTLEKILDLYIQETGYGMDMWSKEENAAMSVVAKIIQSLSQPKIPIGFECETRVFEEEYRKPIRIATITTPEGHTQWLGTYIYE